jgi:hypothetical protein
MRTLTTLVLLTFMIVAPTYSFAADKNAVSTTDKAVAAVKENPGTSVGVVACGVAIALFPPSLLICGGILAAGIGVDATNK